MTLLNSESGCHLFSLTLPVYSVPSLSYLLFVFNLQAELPVEDSEEESSGSETESDSEEEEDTVSEER